MNVPYDTSLAETVSYCKALGELAATPDKAGPLWVPCPAPRPAPPRTTPRTVPRTMAAQACAAFAPLPHPRRPLVPQARVEACLALLTRYADFPHIVAEVGPLLKAAVNQLRFACFFDPRIPDSPDHDGDDAFRALILRCAAEACGGGGREGRRRTVGGTEGRRDGAETEGRRARDSATAVLCPAGQRG